MEKNEGRLPGESWPGDQGRGVMGVIRSVTTSGCMITMLVVVFVFLSASFSLASGTGTIEMQPE